MSSAFVRESEEQWLHEVGPSTEALIAYLSGQNNGIRVNVKKMFINPEDAAEHFEMSNGLVYAKDKERKWYVV